MFFFDNGIIIQRFSNLVYTDSGIMVKYFGVVYLSRKTCSTQFQMFIKIFNSYLSTICVKKQITWSKEQRNIY